MQACLSLTVGNVIFVPVGMHNVESFSYLTGENPGELVLHKKSTQLRKRPPSSENLAWGLQSIWPPPHVIGLEETSPQRERSGNDPRLVKTNCAAQLNCRE